MLQFYYDFVPVEVFHSLTVSFSISGKTFLPYRSGDVKTMITGLV